MKLMLHENNHDTHISTRNSFELIKKDIIKFVLEKENKVDKIFFWFKNGKVIVTYGSENSYLYISDLHILDLQALNSYLGLT